MKAIYHLLNSPPGVSSTKLAVFLGITQLSSWFLLHRLRQACQGCDELLKGVVEADETYLGGLERNKHADKKSRRSRGRSLLKKLGILGLVQRSENGVKAMYWARCMDRLDAASIRREINRRMRPDALLAAYEAPPCNSFRRKTVNHSRGQYVNGIASTNRVESLWAVVKRAFKGVHVKISRERINRYLDEATFRPTSSPRTTPMMTRPRLLPRAPSGARRLGASSWPSAAIARRELSRGDPRPEGGGGLSAPSSPVMANFPCWEDGASTPRMAQLGQIAALLSKND